MYGKNVFQMHWKMLVQIQPVSTKFEEGERLYFNIVLIVDVLKDVPLFFLEIFPLNPALGNISKVSFPPYKVYNSGFV